MSTRRTTASASVTDMLLGVVLIAAGVCLLAGTYIKVIPSLPGLTAFVLVAGVLGIAGALAGRTSAGFFSEIVSAALLIALAAVAIRFPDTPGGSLIVLAGALVGANGVVRVASATEYPALRGVFLVGGAASLGLAAAVFSGAVPGTLLMLSVIMGTELCIDGASALLIGRHEHPHR